MSDWKPDNEIVQQCDHVRITRLYLSASVSFRVDWCKHQTNVLYSADVVLGTIDGYRDQTSGIEILREMKAYFADLTDWQLVQGLGSDKLLVYAKVVNGEYVS